MSNNLFFNPNQGSGTQKRTRNLKENLHTHKKGSPLKWESCKARKTIWVDHKSMFAYPKDLTGRIVIELGLTRPYKSLKLVESLLSFGHIWANLAITRSKLNASLETMSTVFVVVVNFWIFIGIRVSQSSLSTPPSSFPTQVSFCEQW